MTSTLVDGGGGRSNETRYAQSPIPRTASGRSPDTRFLYHCAVQGRVVRAFARVFALTVVVLSVSCHRQTDRLNVLLVTLDTTRADRIGCYGRDDASTPVMDALAADGFVFERCTSTNPITTPSHSTIMTGSYPMLHGVRDNGLFTLPDGRTTLAEVFQANGWATAAAVASFPLTRQFGLDQGFDFFDDDIEEPYENFRGDRIVTTQKLFFDERPAGNVNQAIIPWLEDNATRPFFAWVHYFDPHQPLVPPTPYNELFAHDLYQGEIAYVDESLGRVLAILEDAEVRDRTLVVVVGDHGEGLGEHDELTHSLLCYDTTIRVPLIIKVPRSVGGVRIAGNVGTVDLAPTILDLVGLPIPGEVQGRSLRPLLGPGGETVPADPRAYYSETLSPRLAHGWSEIRVLLDGRWKYLHSSKPELYDLELDPSERHDLASDRPDVVEEMRVKLDRFISDMSAPSAADAVNEFDAETIQRLAALGYLGTSRGQISTGGGETIYAEGVAPRDRAGDVSRWSMVKDYIFSKRYLEAREIAQGLADEDPTNPLYLSLLALAQHHLGQDDEALKTLGRSASPIAQASGLYLALGRSLMARGDSDRALQLVEPVVAELPSADGFYTLAGMYKGVGDVEAYRSALVSTLDADPKYVPARVALAVEAARSGDFPTAEAGLTRALEDGPLYVPGHFNLGMVYLDTGRPAEAVSCFDRARSLNRQYWPGYLGSIAARLALGDAAAAAEVLEDLATRKAPGDVLDQAAALMEAQ